MHSDREFSIFQYGPGSQLINNQLTGYGIHLSKYLCCTTESDELLSNDVKPGYTIQFV